MYIDTNFVAINFQFGGILIVNLSSRKNFQIEYDVLENQIKLVPIRYSDFLSCVQLLFRAKLDEGAQEHPRFDWTQATNFSSMILWIGARKNYVKLKYQITVRYMKIG